MESWKPRGLAAGAGLREEPARAIVNARMNQRRALITGITGQDGSYLAELLLEQGYEVFGLVRRSSSANLARIQHILPRLHLVQGDLLDQSSLMRALAESRPQEIYNLAAQSFVPTSFDEPVHTAEITGIGVTRLLEALRHVAPKARFYQASTSEMFGHAAETPQRETTPFHPRSPYGVAKAYAHWITVNFRESYGLFCTSGILFNHESPRRGTEFVTRKITRAAARIALGLERQLVLGNLEARRDWGFAGDYVRAMWSMLQQPEPSDFVIATGVVHSVREVCELAFEEAGLDWREHVSVDAAFERPAEVHLLCGDASKARAELGWQPRMDFQTLIRTMLQADLEAERGNTAGTARVPSATAPPRGAAPRPSGIRPPRA
jgi:GDPmannose 4,6-dehydratase